MGEELAEKEGYLKSSRAVEEVAEGGMVEVGEGRRMGYLMIEVEEVAVYYFSATFPILSY